MKATVLGLGALTLAGLTAPASALPLGPGPVVAPGNGLEQARVMRRTIVRGPAAAPSSPSAAVRMVA